MDLLKELPEKIWVSLGNSGGYWQKIEYSNVPSYCKHCWHVGHSEALCHIHNPELRVFDQPRTAPPGKDSKDQQPVKLKQVYVPKLQAQGQQGDPLTNTGTDESAGIQLEGLQVHEIGFKPQGKERDAYRVGID